MPNERTVSKGYCIVLVFYTSMISLRNLKDFTILSEIKFIFFNCLMKIYRYTKGCLNLFYSFYFLKGFLWFFSDLLFILVVVVLISFKKRKELMVSCRTAGDFRSLFE